MCLDLQSSFSCFVGAEQVCLLYCVFFLLLLLLDNLLVM
jgi:hypothetical protein